MGRPTVLVVDDDPGIAVALERGLRLGGFDVTTVGGGLDALEQIQTSPPDAVVLDIGLPDLDGVAVCERLRAEGVEVPVCILSALDDVEDRLAGLRAGADDYLVKPFSLEELRLRLVALLRRARPADDARGVRSEAAGPLPTHDVGGLRVDPARRQVLLDGHEVTLTRREFDLLEVLARSRGVVLSRERLLSEVWGYDFEASTNVVDVFVGYLRRKL
ncbi:MAG: response regulator transcription factor, partial [Phycicoccus sp.]